MNNDNKYRDGDSDSTLYESGEIVFSNMSNRLNEVEVGKLFDRFYSAETAKKSIGLDLAITRTFIDQMSGTISAKYVHNRLWISIQLADV